MEFTKRDDILVGWGNNEIEYYLPLVQSLGVNINTNIATITQSGTYQRRQEILASPIIEVPIEILGKDNVINEEFYFFNAPSEIEKPIFKSINSPINIYVLLNDKDEYDDLIKTVESVSEGETHDVYGLEIYDCYLSSYSCSIEAGGLITHNLSFSGSNIEGKRMPIINANNNDNLVPKNIGLASKFNLYSSGGIFNQPVSSFSLSLNIDRKTKYIFKNKDMGNTNNNNLLNTRINKEESSSICTIDISTISDLKCEEFTTEYLRDAKSLLKDFRIIHDEPSTNGAPIRTSINFYDTTLNNVEIEENVDGLMNISYNFNVNIPTENINSIKSGITTRKRYEKYFLAKNRADIVSIDENYRTDLQNGTWDWEIDNLEDGTSLFDYKTYPSEDILEEFTSSCPKLVNAYKMFYKASKLKKLNLYLPKCKDARFLAYGTPLLEEAILDLPECTSFDESFRANSNLKKLTIKRHNCTSANIFIYYDKKLQKIDMDFSDITSLVYFAERSGLIEFKHNTSKVVNGGNSFFDIKTMKEFNSPLPLAKYFNNAFANTNIVTLRYPIDVDGNCIYSSGKPQATNTDGSGVYEYLTLPNIIEAGNIFRGCRIDLPSALSMLKSLQQKDLALGSSSNYWIFTLGMENTYKDDPSLLEAIQQATDKGWQINMQWATPYDPWGKSSRLRSFSLIEEEKPSWFKMQEYDGGEYEDEYGRKMQILKADEIFCDSKTPSKLGYQKFSSYEEAADKWKLIYKGSQPPTEI